MEQQFVLTQTQTTVPMETDADMVQDFLAYSQPEKKEGWTCKDEVDANWVLGMIKKAQAEQARLDENYQAMQNQLDAWHDDRSAKLDAELEHWKTVLNIYADNALKDGKKKSMSLPNGKIGFRKMAPAYERDEKALMAFVKASAPAYIKVKESVDWSGLKKACKVDGDHLVTADGEIVDGVTVTPQDPKFFCEVD